MAAAARGRPSGTEAWRIASSARRSAKSRGGAGGLGGMSAAVTNDAAPSIQALRAAHTAIL
eukprot:1554406-Prymnesium_polylepis.1